MIKTKLEKIEDRLEKIESSSPSMIKLFTIKGKPIAKNFEFFYGLGRDSFNRLKENHRRALVRYASSTKKSNISIIDITFTSDCTVEVQYNIGTFLKTEKCLFDNKSLEFYSMPIHIEKENRYEDFRSKSCSTFLMKLEEYLGGGSASIGQKWRNYHRERDRENDKDKP